MGNRQSICGVEQLENYEECTYLTKAEILTLYKKFAALNPTKINPSKLDATTRLTFDEVAEMPELRVNPFRHRICQVFATDDGMHFEDFLDLCSVFSGRCPWQLKAKYAFMICDFNNDALLCADDIKCVIHCYGGFDFQEAELQDIVQGVLNEVAGTDTGLEAPTVITYSEFEQMLSKETDFYNLFRISM